MRVDAAVGAASAAQEKALVVHEDALEAASCTASRSIDRLLWQGSADVAKAVTLFGPGIVVLPMLGKVSGVSEEECLTYASHPKRLAKGGLMDRVDLEAKFGQIDPARLVEELAGGRAGLERRLRDMTGQQLQDEVMALQDWRAKANGRMTTLEKRAAWAFLGIPAGSASQAAVRKAFKRKALELHPDKGGDADRFQLLQQMKELLIQPTAQEVEHRQKEDQERSQEAEKAAKDAEDREQRKKDEAFKDKDQDHEDEFSCGFSSDLRATMSTRS
ncbi:unnamed protein product [Prorocentrum cordatum]|uniref:J domain-containing protein n=1 Tax=Prorocentrum cordatum TaxID=2364126 RepID=A0ABN9T754_9DINO|nr:unnamed protein product [Polarella glacialis]